MRVAAAVGRAGRRVRDQPEGFHCNAQPAQEGVCRPDGAEDTGCCSVDGTGRGAMLANVGLGGLIALLVARRRRRR